MPLVSDIKTVEQTLGFLASLAIHNFSFSGVFLQCEGKDYADIDSELQNAEPMFKIIRHPGALRVLHSSISFPPQPKAPLLRYSVYKFLERLAQHSHRNHAVVASINLVGSLFEAFYNSERQLTGEDGNDEDTRMPQQERQVIVKLLKRLLELGATTEEARTMFRRAVREDESLDVEVLEVLRAGLKNRWPQHLSLDGPAALTMHENPSKGLPPGGFTFMVTDIFCRVI